MNYYKNNVYYFEVLVTNDTGNFVSGLTINYSIYKSSDNGLITSGIMVEVGTSGVYQFPYTFIISGQYRIEYYPTNLEYPKTGETVIIEETSDLSTLEDLIRKTLGLSQSNYLLKNPVYDKNKNLVSATIKIFNSASDCNNDVSPLASYNIVATFNSKGLMQTYKVIEI